jgi:hypothetical protein
MLSILRSLWEGWKRVAKRLGDLQARILLIIFYFLALGPFAIAVRWWSDPMAIKPASLRGWRPKAEEEGTPMERAMIQS